MSIATEISRLQSAKADIKTSIEAKGVTVPSSATLDSYDTYIDQIPTGGGTDITIDSEYFTTYVSASTSTGYQYNYSTYASIPIKWARLYNIATGTYTELADGTYDAYTNGSSTAVYAGTFTIATTSSGKVLRPTKVKNNATSVLQYYHTTSTTKVANQQIIFAIDWSRVSSSGATVMLQDAGDLRLMYSSARSTRQSNQTYPYNLSGSSITAVPLNEWVIGTLVPATNNIQAWLKYI